MRAQGMFSALESIVFSISCGDPLIMDGYVAALAQQGFYREADGALALIIDIPRGIALRQMEMLRNTAQQVVVVTWSTCPEYGEDLWDAGPNILIVGGGLASEVGQALRDAQRGLRYRRILDNSSILQPIERRILRLLAQGHSNQNIAKQLYISVQTVKNSLTNIHHKLEVTDRSQAILYYWGIWYNDLEQLEEI